MRKKVLFIGLMGLMALACLSACGKEHQCKCTSEDGYDDGTTQNIFYLDGNISCEDITEMAYEEHVAEAGVNSLHRVEVHKVKCRDYGN